MTEEDFNLQALGEHVFGTPSTNGAPLARNLGTQTWRAFEQSAGEDVPTLIRGLWPEGALGFIGAAPKAGKTWLALDIAVSVATGTPVFGSFLVAQPMPVMYVALEGHKAAIRGRIGCIARGHGVHPEDAGLDNLHLSYKPRGINLADPSWAAALCENAAQLGTRLVIVDVLRRAAQIKENEASSFMELIGLLAPLGEQNIALALLHHFIKTNEVSKERTPGERMAGSGAMFGAFDVGIFITKSEGHARKLTIHTDIRDLAAPDRFIVTLQGQGSGPHGGFTYRDNLRLLREDAPDPEVTMKAPPKEIVAFIASKGPGVEVYPREIKTHFDLNDQQLLARRERLIELGVIYTSAAKNSSYSIPETPTPPHPSAPLQTAIGGVAADDPSDPSAPTGWRGVGGVQDPPPPQPTIPGDNGGVDYGDNFDDLGYLGALAEFDPSEKEHDDMPPNPRPEEPAP